MHTPLRQYQQQAVLSASPEQLIAKLYDFGIAACHTGDTTKLRRVLVELISALNFEKGGEIAQRLHAIYEYCLMESASGSLSVVLDLLSGLRDAWRDVIVASRRAA